MSVHGARTPGSASACEHGPQIERIADLRHHRLDLRLTAYPLAQRTRRAGLAMRDKRHARKRWSGLEPAHQLVAVRMTRHTLDAEDLGGDRHISSVHPQRLRAIEQLPAPRTRRLIADEDDE